MTTVNAGSIEPANPVVTAQKRYCSRALITAVVVGAVLIGLGYVALGKGLVLGALFSVFNFVLMGSVMPMKIGHSRGKTMVIAMGSLAVRMLLLALPMAARPLVPLFGILLTGVPAVLFILAGAVICAYLARSCYRLEMSAWWGTVGLMALLGVATAVSFATIAPAEIYRALGYPEEQISMLEASGAFGGPTAVWIAVIFTLASLAYMAAIRKHFRSGSAEQEKV